MRRILILTSLVLVAIVLWGCTNTGQAIKRMGNSPDIVVTPNGKELFLEYKEGVVSITASGKTFDMTESQLKARSDHNSQSGIEQACCILEEDDNIRLEFIGNRMTCWLRQGAWIPDCSVSYPEETGAASFMDHLS